MYPNFAIASLRVRMHPLLARTSANLKHRGLGVFSTVLHNFNWSVTQAICNMEKLWLNVCLHII